MEVFCKSHFSFQMGNSPLGIAEDSGLILISNRCLGCEPRHLWACTYLLRWSNRFKNSPKGPKCSLSRFRMTLKYIGMQLYPCLLLKRKIRNVKHYRFCSSVNLGINKAMCQCPCMYKIVILFQTSQIVYLIFSLSSHTYVKQSPFEIRISGFYT